MHAVAVIFDNPISYDRGVRLQEQLVRARASDTIEDTVLFLEHDPVITMGCRGRSDHLLSSREELSRQGILLAQSSRGGDVTFHGPGQVVMYPIIKLGSREADAHGYLHNLEEIAIRTAASFGVDAFRRDGMNGAWTEHGKFAAIGFRLKRWVTCHGMSINVDVDLKGFSYIVPCGLSGEAVTSLKEIVAKHAPTLSEVREAMSKHFEDVCGRALTRVSTESSPEAIRKIIRATC